MKETCLNVAVCDDDKSFLHKFKEKINTILKSYGISFQISCYFDAYRLIHDVKDGCYFDIIILDIDMPKMRGNELAEELRRISTGYHLILPAKQSGKKEKFLRQETLA